MTYDKKKCLLDHRLDIDLAHPGSIPSNDTLKKKKIASAGNRTRINCLEGSYADHYTTDA